MKDIKLGKAFTEDNIRSIRPWYGLSTKHIDIVLGEKAKLDIEMGTPLSWNLIR